MPLRYHPLLTDPLVLDAAGLSPLEAFDHLIIQESQYCNFDPYRVRDLIDKITEDPALHHDLLVYEWSWFSASHMKIVIAATGCSKDRLLEIAERYSNDDYKRRLFRLEEFSAFGPSPGTAKAVPEV
jgi:hypothetical protein